MKKLFIGLVSTGAIISAPIIAYVTTTKDKIEEKASTQVHHYDLVKRLSFAAKNLALPKQEAREFITSLKNHNSDTLATTEGMYVQAKSRLIGRKVIDNYTDFYEEDGHLKVVFYYDGFKYNPKDAGLVNNHLDFFKNQPAIRNHLIKNVYNLETNMEVSQIGAVAIFTLDKNDDVIGITVGERNTTEKYLFKNVEELLVFKYNQHVVTTAEELKGYMWLSKYGVAVKDVKNTPFHYISGREDLSIKPALDASNIFGFTHIQGHPNVLAWIPTDSIADPFLAPRPEENLEPNLISHNKEETEQKEPEVQYIEPVIDRTTLMIPPTPDFPVPVVGDTGHIPPATKHPEQHVPVLDPETLKVPAPEPTPPAGQDVRPPMPAHLIQSW